MQPRCSIFRIAVVLAAFGPAHFASAEPFDYDKAFDQQFRIAILKLTPTKEADLDQRYTVDKPDKDGVPWSYDQFKEGYAGSVAYVQEFRQKHYSCWDGARPVMWSFDLGKFHGADDAFNQLTRVYETFIHRLQTDDYDRDVNVGSGLLFHALRINDICGLELLLSRGANVMAEHPFYRRPLDMAAQHGNLDVVRLLLKYKSPIYVEGNIDTPAHRARNVEVLKEILDHCGDLHEFQKRTTSLIHWHSANRDRLKLLLRYGVNPNERDSDGQSCLHKSEDAGIAKLLIEHGADVNLLNKDGATPLDVCRDRDVIRVLEKHNAKLRKHARDPLWPVRNLDEEIPLTTEDVRLEQVFEYVAVCCNVEITVDWKSLQKIGVKPDQQFAFDSGGSVIARDLLRQIIAKVKAKGIEIKPLSENRVEIRAADPN